MTSRDIEAVNQLLRPHKMWINVTEQLRYQVNAPCLLAQLRDAIGIGIERGTGSGVPSSLSLVDTDALDLWCEISTHAHYVAHMLKLNRRDPGTRSEVPWVGRLLRHACAEAAARGIDRVANRIGDKALEWAGRIEGMLSGHHTQRGIRGAACEQCGQSRILEQRADGLYRVPAIVLITRESLRWLVCLACGDTKALPGDDEAVFVYESECES